MTEHLNKLKIIKAKANAIANRIDVNCVNSEMQYSELAQLANELGGIINAIEASSNQ